MWFSFFIQKKQRKKKHRLAYILLHTDTDSCVCAWVWKTVRKGAAAETPLAVHWLNRYNVLLTFFFIFFFSFLFYLHIKYNNQRVLFSFLQYIYLHKTKRIFFNKFCRAKICIFVGYLRDWLFLHANNVLFIAGWVKAKIVFFFV